LEGLMLRLGDGQVECLWDEVLPAEARALPDDLAALDGLLADPALLAPPDDLDADLPAADGHQAPHRLGV
jgi:hypothetical protein